MSDDTHLLRQYVTERSEPAFAELVRRHVNLVHSAALRQVSGDLHRAQDVTQAVFCELARKAPSLLQHRALSGWLYTTARFVGARFQRMDSRRIARELTPHIMTQALQQPASDPVWRELQPVLDDAMQELADKDRYAIILRFFEDKPLAEVGAGLGLTENAARMRVGRALEKLRAVLARRGIKSTTSVLGTALVVNAVAPAPVGLAAALAGPAMASAAASVGIVPGMAFSLFHMMNSTKIAIAVSAVTMTSLVGTYVGMNSANAQLRAEVAALRSQPAPTSGQPVRSGSETHMNAEEPARLRLEHSELMRLRGEVGVLRKTADDLAQALRETASGLTDEQVLALGQSRGFQELMGSAKMNYTRGWFSACQSFAQQNAGHMPGSLEQAELFFESPKGWEWTAGLLARNDFEIVYHGSLEQIEHPERTILLREKQPFDVPEASGTRKARTYGFADGHTEVHFSSDGDFEVWERDRMVASAP